MTALEAAMQDVQSVTTEVKRWTARLQWLIGIVIAAWVTVLVTNYLNHQQAEAAAQNAQTAAVQASSANARLGRIVGN